MEFSKNESIRTICFMCVQSVLLGCFPLNNSLNKVDQTLNQPKITNGESLKIKSFDALPLRIGENKLQHHSLNIVVVNDVLGDYVKYKIYRTKDSKIVKNGKIYYGPKIFHDLVSGDYIIYLWPCIVAERVTDGGDACGKLEKINYHQFGNIDVDLKNILNQAKDLTEEQREIVNKILEEIKKFRQEFSQHPLAEMSEREKLLLRILNDLKNVEPELFGDVIVNTYIVEEFIERQKDSDSSTNNQNNDPDNIDLGSEDSVINITNGVALIYLVHKLFKSYNKSKSLEQTAEELGINYQLEKTEEDINNLEKLKEFGALDEIQDEKLTRLHGEKKIFEMRQKEINHEKYSK